MCINIYIKSIKLIYKLKYFEMRHPFRKYCELIRKLTILTKDNIYFHLV